jgi:predicted neutral ceramidase superfamily lipid hydrolase
MKRYELDLVNFIRDRDSFQNWITGFTFLGPVILILIFNYGLQMRIEFNFVLYMTFFILTLASYLYVDVFVIGKKYTKHTIQGYYEQYTLAYASLFVISSSQVDSKSEVIDLNDIDEEKVTKMVSAYNTYKWLPFIIGTISFSVCAYLQAQF